MKKVLLSAAFIYQSLILSGIPSLVFADSEKTFDSPGKSETVRPCEYNLDFVLSLFYENIEETNEVKVDSKEIKSFYFTDGITFTAMQDEMIIPACVAPHLPHNSPTFILTRVLRL